MGGLFSSVQKADIAVLGALTYIELSSALRIREETVSFKTGVSNFNFQPVPIYQFP